MTAITFNVLVTGGAGQSINYDAFRPLVHAAKRAGVKRFIYASSSSVYGVNEGIEVAEDLSLEPLTGYSRYKALCEEILAEERAPGFTTLTLRPATWLHGLGGKIRILRGYTRVPAWHLSEPASSAHAPMNSPG